MILVGERAAAASGTLSAVRRLAARSGARVAWVPRRAGDRGAVEAGCLPNLLPGGRPVGDAAARVDAATVWGAASLPGLPGRDADEMLSAAADGDLEALVVGGIDPDDFADPQAVLEGLEKVGFVVSLEIRASAVTERADVVFPVSLMSERAGTFVTWEGRRRPFPAVLSAPNAMSDLRVLAALADALDVPLGFRTAAQALAELDEFGPWPRETAPTRSRSAPACPRRAAGPSWCWPPGGWGWTRPGPWTVNRSCWAPPRRPWPGSARPRPPASAWATTRTAATVVLSTDRGSIALPVSIEPGMIDGVVWVPSRAPGLGVGSHLAAVAGDLVTVSSPARPPPPRPPPPDV